MTTPVSGVQYRLRNSGYEAVIASVGASLRVLTKCGRDLVVRYAEHEVRPAYSGAILAPWPNRIGRGLYTENGVELQLPLTEPARGHALHGLVAWADFEAVDVSEDAVTLRTSITPQWGYPHRVLVSVAYRLTEAGLGVTVRATNMGSSTAPVGLGSHPYLVGGEGRVDDWLVRIPAAVVMLVDEALMPVCVEPVSDTAFDFRLSHPVGDLFIDHAFTGLIPDADGRHRVQVLAANGTGVEISWGGGMPWLQIHTADNPDPRMSRLGLAVEPMTCPPDAFNSGTDVIRVEPGASTSAAWTISAC